MAKLALEKLNDERAVARDDDGGEYDITLEHGRWRFHLAYASKELKPAQYFRTPEEACEALEVELGQRE